MDNIYVVNQKGHEKNYGVIPCYRSSICIS